jgi:carbon-monoxide dehydrogenase medium subunit/xanthine dehydrogenase FAD-binding subunit
LKEDEVTLRFVLDIGRIAELRAIRDEGDYIFVGATATHTEIAESELIREQAPLLAEAALSIGSLQIRNVGTIGGNIVNASPAADTLPALIALDAEAYVVSQGKNLHVPVADLLDAPYKTRLLPSHLLYGVRFAKLRRGAGTCFLKLGRRRALVVARASVAVIMVPGENGRLKDVRICPGAVTPFPIRMISSEELVKAEFPSEEVFQKAGQMVSKEMVRLSGWRPSTPYKEPVLAHLAHRALSMAAERCAGR